jgi:hypothetical protein
VATATGRSLCHDDVDLLTEQMQQLCDAVRELARLQALKNTKLDAAIRTIDG